MKYHFNQDFRLYNFMRTVNQVDMQMSFSEFLQKSVKWYKKIAFYLIDLAVFNAYVLFKIKNFLNLFSDFKLQLMNLQLKISLKNAVHCKSIIGRSQLSIIILYI